MSDRKEYIERGALLDYLGADLEEDLQPEVVMEFVESIPAADVVEVVRCSQCKYGRELDRNDPFEDRFVDGCVWCMERGDGMFEADYCSYGERKNGADETSQHL